MNKQKTITIQKGKDSNLLYVVIDKFVDYDKLSRIIEEEFSLKPCSDFLTDITGDKTFKEYKNKNYKISLGFGEWYPYVIFSETLTSNQLIEEIYEWLHTIDIPK